MKQTEQQSSGRNQDNSNQRLSKEHFASMMELSGSQKQGYIRAFVEATLLEGGAGPCAPEWAVYRRVFDDVEAATQALELAQCEGSAKVWGVPSVEVTKVLWLAEQVRAGETKGENVINLPSNLAIERFANADLKRTVSSKWEERAKKLIKKLRRSPRPFWGVQDSLMSCAVGLLLLFSP
ncbi:unnamed protein product [Cladocopium goreaui]|uniref:Uncharacterized protein n=1 Tax=Cladocopium goreaui TaxID=2562237 RepID=A0A9P1CFE9_9DINO|nr:unnamed protein product [Cladocopium goreaui]